MESELPTSPEAPVPLWPVNLYQLYLGCFFGRLSLFAKSMDNTAAVLLGLGCCIAYNLSVVDGAYLIYRNVEAAFSYFPGNIMFAPGMPAMPTIPGLPGSLLPIPKPTGLSAEEIYKIILAGFTPWFTVIAGCFVARKTFSREERPFSGDILISGLTLLPVGLFVLMFGLLGFSNWNAVAVVFVVSLTYAVMFLHQGLVVVSRIPNTAAAISVPLVLVLSAWLTKIVFTRMLGF